MTKGLPATAGAQNAILISKSVGFPDRNMIKVLPCRVGLR